MHFVISVFCNESRQCKNLLVGTTGRSHSEQVNTWYFSKRDGSSAIPCFCALLGVQGGVFLTGGGNYFQNSGANFDSFVQRFAWTG